MGVEVNGRCFMVYTLRCGRTVDGEMLEDRKDKSMSQSEAKNFGV